MSYTEKEFGDWQLGDAYSFGEVEVVHFVKLKDYTLFVGTDHIESLRCKRHLGLGLELEEHRAPRLEDNPQGVFLRRKAAEAAEHG